MQKYSFLHYSHYYKVWIKVLSEKIFFPLTVKDWRIFHQNDLLLNNESFSKDLRNYVNTIKSPSWLVTAAEESVASKNIESMYIFHSRNAM